jgi:hypothetical protein
MKKRKNHDAGFKAREALEVVKGERTVSELAAEYGVQTCNANTLGMACCHRASSNGSRK